MVNMKDQPNDKITEVSFIKPIHIVYLLLIAGFASFVLMFFFGIIPLIVSTACFALLLYIGLKNLRMKSKYDDSEMNPIGATIAILAAIMLISVLFITTASVVTVDAGNKAVVVGSPNGDIGTTLNEGWHFNPQYVLYNIDTIRYNTQTESFVGEDLADDNAGSIWVLSKDNLGIFLDFSIIYAIPADNVSHIRMTYGADFKETLIIPVGRSVPRDVCAQYDALEIIGDKRSEVENSISYGVTSALEGYGFDVVDVTLRDVRPPQTMIDAIESKKVAEQNVITAEYNKQKVVIDAQAAQTRVLIEADAEAQARIINANGSAEAIKTVMEMFSIQDPNSTNSTQQYLQWLFIQALTDPNSNIQFYIVPSDGVPIILNPSTETSA